MFSGRKLVIATKHGKEKVIAPILEGELNVICSVIPDLETDILGTFTGEIERKYDPITTLRKKCELAMERSNCDLAVASEGSFGSHPSMYFIPADDELMLLYDKKNDIEIIARELSAETNFNQSEIRSEEKLREFITKTKFPSHALIIRSSKDEFTDIVKGIHDTALLFDTFKKFMSKYGTSYIETDMRAMHNPTRMKIIEKATQKLAEKTNSICPNCSMPGFGITHIKPGLPCELCKSPTNSTLSHIYVCQKCSHSKEKKYPNGKNAEEPLYCDFCNP
jgi:hypothetical protein